MLARSPAAADLVAAVTAATGALTRVHRCAQRASTNLQLPVASPPVPSSTILGCSRTPAAATSSTPASSNHPNPSHLALWMRKSEGYALVPSAAASVAFSARPARCRRHFGRRRRKSVDDDVGIISG